MNIKIIKECSDYLRESNGNALCRFLPKRGSDFRKVKVRRKRAETDFDQYFNETFINHPDIRQRCIFANGLNSIDSLTEAQDPELDKFYIFPVDGYKFIYSPEVINSYLAYSDTFETLVNLMGEKAATSKFHKILEYNYTSENLVKGIKSGSEIILYGVPHYYAIRCSSVKSYSTLFSL